MLLMINRKIKRRVIRMRMIIIKTVVVVVYFKVGIIIVVFRLGIHRLVKII